MQLKPPSRCTLVAAALILVFMLQCFFASRLKSPTYDEPPHIAAGLSYLETRVFHANLQHPPLLKELSALSLLLAGVRWPQIPEAEALTEGASHPQWHPGLEWRLGNEIIRTNGPDRVMFWARLPLILVATLLGILIYLWGRKIVGEAAAVGAVFLYALDPTVVAHSFLVTTDVGCATFVVAFLFALWSYLRRPNLGRLALCGVALGGALGAKFSSVALVPVAAVLMVAAALLPDGWRTVRLHFPRQLATICLAFLSMCAISALVVEALYLFPHNLLLYAQGIRQVNADHQAGYMAYMAGALSHHFYSYFVVSYLLEEPIAGIILLGLGLLVVWRTRRLSPLDKLFLVFPPAVLLAGYSLKADNDGIRLIIPVLPFAYLIGGMGLARLLQGKTVEAANQATNESQEPAKPQNPLPPGPRPGTRMWPRAAAAVLCAWLVMAAIGIYPDHLAYFNEAACLLRDPSQVGFDGGTRCGPMWLSDSNVDWGQGLKQLKSWLEQNAQGRTVRLAYFGSFPPESYGISYEPLEFVDLQSPVPPRGIVIVSAHLVANVPAMVEKKSLTIGSWLRDLPPTAIIGHSLYVYDFPENPNRQRL